MREMNELGYQDVHLDDMGNVLGRFGTGPRVLAFDAHIDTVGISNPTHWRHDPFRGIVTGGTLRNLAKLDRRARRYPITRLHGYVLERRSALVRKVAEHAGLDWNSDSPFGTGTLGQALLVPAVYFLLLRRS